MFCVERPFVSLKFSTSANVNMDVSENSGTPKSSLLIGFSIINHPFWGTPIFGNTHITSTWLKTHLGPSWNLPTAQYFLEQLARAERSALGSRVHGDRGDLR